MATSPGQGETAINGKISYSPTRTDSSGSAAALAPLTEARVLGSTLAICRPCRTEKPASRLRSSPFGFGKNSIFHLFAGGEAACCSKDLLEGATFHVYVVNSELL